MEESNDPNLSQEQTVPPVMPANAVPPPMSQYPRVNTQPIDANDDPLRFVIPLNPSVWAIISGYLGLFSVLCVFGPFSLATGIYALQDIKKNPNKTGKGRAIFGIVMGALGTIGLVAILNKR